MTVEVVFGREFYGTLVAALALEVAGKRLDAVDFALFLGDHVQHLLVLLGADGERGGKVVESQFLREPCRFAESQFKALAAALAAFLLVFEPACNLVELLGVVLPLDKFHRILCLERGDEPLDFGDAVGVFFGGGDIRVVVENRYLEELREVLNAVGTAGPAAGVHQERGHVALALVPPDDVAQVSLVVVIRFRHLASPS